MLIFYGDYKDLDNINIYDNKGNPNPKAYGSDHVDYLFTKFMDFVNGNFKLEPTRKLQELYDSCVKILIDHSNYGEGRAVTHYTIVEESAGRPIDDAREYYENWYVDKENEILVCEHQENRCIPFISLQDLIKAKIIDCEADYKKWAEIKYTDIGLDKETWEKILEDILKRKKKWENKTSQRWFYETEVSA